jgi:hypothetical protein
MYKQGKNGMTMNDDISSETEKEHKLENEWSFWFLRRVQGAKSQENYEKNIKKIASFSSVSTSSKYA